MSTNALQADATKVATGILDKLPASIRHLTIMGIAYGLDHAAQAIHSLHLTATQAGAAGIGATWLTLIFTPLTNQYGYTFTALKNAK